MTSQRLVEVSRTGDRLRALSGGQDLELSTDGIYFGNAVPRVDDLYNLGSASRRWAEAYFHDLDVTVVSSDLLRSSGTQKIGASGSPWQYIYGETVVATLLQGKHNDVLPITTTTYALGSVLLNWKSLSMNDGASNLSISTGLTPFSGGGQFNTLVSQGATVSAASSGQTLLGYGAQSTGASSTALGYQALAAASSLALGAGSVASASNTVAIASSNASSGTVKIGTQGTHTSTVTAGHHLPTQDNTYDVGDATRWRNGNFGGTVTAASLVGNLTGDVTGNLTGNVTGSSGSSGSATTATTASTANALNSASTVVNVNAATAPVAGQLLQATGPSNAIWARVLTCGNISSAGVKISGPSSLTTSQLGVGSYRAVYSAGFWSGNTGVTPVASAFVAGCYVEISGSAASGDGSATLEFQVRDAAGVAQDGAVLFFAMQSES